MTRFYVAADGNYGDAKELLTFDPEELGVPIDGYMDALSDYDRMPVARNIIKNLDRYKELVAAYQKAEQGDPADAILSSIADLIGVDFWTVEAMIGA